MPFAISRRYIAAIVTVLLLVALLVILLASGSKKKNIPVSSVMLNGGTGAVLVVFPATRDVVAENWMAQINLEGDQDTKSLPRIPLSELNAVIVLNVPPGKYKVMAHAWLRRSPPRVGGSLEGVRVTAGEISILRGQALGENLYPYANVQMQKSPSAVWQLDAPDRLRDYLAKVIAEAAHP
jgi:hypothetical protein